MSVSVAFPHHGRLSDHCYLLQSGEICHEALVFVSPGVEEGSGSIFYPHSPCVSMSRTSEDCKGTRVLDRKRLAKGQGSKPRKEQP